MTKRNRTDGVAGQLEIMEGALEPIPDPPVGIKLTKQERVFWDLIIDGKARRAWTIQDMVMAAELARIYYRMQKYSKQCNSRDENKAKAAERLLDKLVRRGKLLCTYLQIHPEATNGKSMRQVDQNEKHRQAKDLREQASQNESSDDLIARPPAPVLQ